MTQTDTFARARRAMIESQLRTSGVNAEFVLKRMSVVPREAHVPEGKASSAYMDRAIRLDDGALASPLFHGMMLQEAEPQAGEHVLIVDNGSGYLPALVAPLVADMTVISPEEALGSGRKGRGANLLLIDGAVEEVPAKLANRLAEGARIVTGLTSNGVTRLAVGRKSDSGVSLLPVHDIGIPQIAAFDKPKGWSF